VLKAVSHAENCIEAGWSFGKEEVEESTMVLMCGTRVPAMRKMF